MPSRRRRRARRVELAARVARPEACAIVTVLRDHHRRASAEVEVGDLTAQGADFYLAVRVLPRLDRAHRPESPAVDACDHHGWASAEVEVGDLTAQGADFYLATTSTSTSTADLDLVRDLVRDLDARPRPRARLYLLVSVS